MNKWLVVLWKIRFPTRHQTPVEWWILINVIWLCIIFLWQNGVFLCDILGQNQVVLIDKTGSFSFDMTHAFSSRHIITNMEVLKVISLANSVLISFCLYLSFRAMCTIQLEIKQIRGNVHSIYHFDVPFNLFFRWSRTVVENITSHNRNKFYLYLYSSIS